MPEYILEVSGIVKTFPGVRALSGVGMKVAKGEVHAVVGENGAGKSTLMLTLGGVHKPDAGEIILENQKVRFDSAKDANEKGVSIVYQELSLVQGLSVAENIFANRQPVGLCGMVNKRKLHEDTAEMLSMFGMEDIRPDTPVKALSIANQQVVEILKAMSFNPKVLIMDEPTSSLTEVEVNQLFRNIDILKEKGIAFIYISHHLNEIFKIADRVTVLRDGEYVCDEDVGNIDEDFLVSKMVGRTLSNIYGVREPEQKIGDKLFEVHSLTRKGAFSDISFHINEGEIVGFAGLVGAGRTELGQSIFGVTPPDSGTIVLDGEELHCSNSNQAIGKNIGYMTEDRKSLGLYLNFTIENNFIPNRLKDFSRNGFLQSAKIRGNALKCIDDFHIVTPGSHQLVRNLSGGNQQKVLLATWFGINPKLLIVDEPTRGVDIGAKNEIYSLLRMLAAKGVAIMMISSDLSEILGVSDRIVVMKEGAIVGELSKSEATEDTVIALAAGAGGN